MPFYYQSRSELDFSVLSCSRLECAVLYKVTLLCLRILYSILSVCRETNYGLLASCTSFPLLVLLIFSTSSVAVWDGPISWVLLDQCGLSFDHPFRYMCSLKESVHFCCYSVVNGGEFLEPETIYSIMAWRFLVWYFFSVVLSNSICISVSRPSSRPTYSGIFPLFHHFGLFSYIFYLRFQSNFPSLFWYFICAFWVDSNFLTN